MADTRDVTITFEDGTNHVYRGVPTSVTPDQIEQRATSEFSGKKLTDISGGSKESTSVPLKKMVEKPFEQRFKETYKPVEEQQKAMRQFTARDQSKVGQVPMSEYLEKGMSGAKYGGGIGGGIGLVTGGPAGMIPGAGIGAISGFAGGIGEALAKDLGYGPGVQGLAGMATGAPVSSIPKFSNTIDALAKNELAQKVMSRAQSAILSSIPKGGLVSKVQSMLPEPKISRSDIAGVLKDPTITPQMEQTIKQTGGEVPSIVPKTAGVSTKNVTEFNNELAQKYGTYTDIKGNVKPMDVDGLYLKAKDAYDTKLASVTPQELESQLKKISDSLPVASRASSMEDIKKLFLNEKGQLLDGARVIDNVKYESEAFQKLNPKEQIKVREVLNDFIGGEEQIARNAAEKQFAASAKDNLPVWFEKNEFDKINRQAGNLAKSPEGQKIFKEEFANYLVKRPVKDAQNMWSNVGAKVKQTIITDPTELKNIESVINNAKTSKDIQRAARLIRRAIAIYEVKKEKK